jgi:spermidine/putrescine ABC transporter ATP-binding subunit
MEPRLNARSAEAAALSVATPALELSTVSRAYGAVPAVDRLSLALQTGEFLTLLGPSGSGKTTALKMIAGFERPDSGTILLGGRDITNAEPNARNIGMVFQTYALFPHMTAFENIAFPLRMRRRSQASVAHSVDRMLAMLHLQDLAQRHPRQLSGGQQQRVALARALVFEPPLLLMDEPLGALDRQLRRQIQTEIKRIHQTLGVSVVFVTHDQEEAMFLSDRIAVMRRGRIVQQGTPAALYAAPNSRFVAEFIGNSNFLPATVTEAADGFTGVTVDGGVAGAGRPVQTLAPGQRVDCLLRPEAIHLGRGSEGTGLRATVELVNFLGDSLELALDTPAGPLTARIPTRSAAAYPAPGEPIDIWWAPADVTIFARDSTA